MTKKKTGKITVPQFNKINNYMCETLPSLLPPEEYSKCPCQFLFSVPLYV